MTTRTPSVKTERNSAVELLRILSMLMIVLSHICLHSGFDYTYSTMTINRLFVQFGILGNLGVGIFLLISGYFLCGRPLKSLSVSRLLAQVWFYSLSLFLICKFGFGVDFTGDSLLAVFFPTVYAEYWFFTAYMVLLLLSPYLNSLIAALSRRQFQGLLTVMGVFWVLIPTITRQQMYGAELSQFLLYYLIGAYFRCYPENRLKKPVKGIVLGLAALFSLYLLTVLLGYCERFTPEAFGAADRFYNRNSLFILLCAVGLFSAAVNCPPFTNRFVNLVSGCTFGVYLIHDHPAVREILWKQLLHHGDYFTSGSFILRVLASVALVYTLCTLIEFLRQKTVADPMTKVIDRLVCPLLRKLPGNHS